MIHLLKKLRAEWQREDIEVLAIGLSGQGLSWQYRKLDQVVDKYRPDIVVSQYSSWFLERDAHFLGDKSQQDDKPANEGAQYRSWSQFIYDNKITHAIIWRNLSNSFGFFLYKVSSLIDGMHYAKQNTKKEENDYEKNLLKETGALYKDMQAKLAAKSIVLKVAIYSSKESIRYYRSAIPNISESVEREWAIEDYLRANQISYVNLSREFAQIEPTPPNGFHYLYDGHWNENGHFYGAQVIAETLFLNRSKK